jgi:hypothetical protein
VGAGSEWSDAELKELGDMLLRGFSIEEIAFRLRRDKTVVRDKVAELGRPCRQRAVMNPGPIPDNAIAKEADPSIGVVMPASRKRRHNTPVSR